MAQTSTSAPPVSSESIQQTQENQAKKGKVILERSIDANGQTVDGPPTAQPAPQPNQQSSPQAAPATATTPATGQTTPPSAQDLERSALTYTDFDIDVRLRPAESYLAVRGLISIRNDGKTPLTHLPLQLSSTLAWDQIRLKNQPLPFTLSILNSDADHTGQLREAYVAVRGLISIRNDGKTPLTHLPLQLSSTLAWDQIRLKNQPLPFTLSILNSDADHTGQLREAYVTLPTPLAPGAGLQLDVTYSGTIALSAKRLLAIGTPQDIAEHSDWDRISADFTGLRGFGNVVWYPVSSVPVILGDGALLFDEIGNHKLRLAGAHFRMALTIETPPAAADGTGSTSITRSIPNIAIINGQPTPLTITLGPDATVSNIATAHVDGTSLGFEAPSLFFANRTSHLVSNAILWTRPESERNVPAWNIAAADVSPFLQSWLGMKPRSQLTILDLPEDGDIPFETAAMLATPIRAAAPDLLEGVMAHALTHAWVMSPRAWLSEGVAHFMGTLWIEKKQGRERALASLDSGRNALAIVEPGTPGTGDGQPLIACISPVYYRTKAAYVFWMLRDLAGDPTLSAAFRAYDPAKDNSLGFFEKLIEQAGPRHDLKWFFNDWVYADKGLPDLSIESVYPTPASVPGSYLVAVNLVNNGYAAVEAPVQVLTESASQTQRVLLAARSKATQRILIQGVPTEVRLNDGTIPETQATIHSKTLDAAVK